MTNNHIIKIENFLTIGQAEFDLKPGVIGFVGKNMAGKTNFIKALNELVDGKHDPEKIKNGAIKAVIRLEIFNQNEEKPQAIISRIQTEKGTKLTAKGLPKGITAAKYLAEIMDAKMLSPIKLIEDDPVRYLKGHLDPELLDSDIPVIFQELKPDDFSEKNPFDYCEKAAEIIEIIRLKLYKEKRDKKGAVEDMAEGMPDEIPKMPHNETECKKFIFNKSKELGAIESKVENFENEKNRIESKILSINSDLDESEMIIDFQDRKIKGLEQEIHECQIKKTKHETILTTKNKEAAELKKELETLIAETKIPDKSELKMIIEHEETKLERIEEHKNLLTRFDKIAEKQSELDEMEERYKELDIAFKCFNTELPKTLISRCSLPVKGIEFRGDDLYINNVRLELLSTTEQALACVKLVAEIAKQRGHIIMSLDGIEMMDEKHRKEFLEIAKNSGLSFWYTRQGQKEADCELVIVDGKINKE